MLAWQEARCALQHSKRLVLVHERDATKHGATLDELRAACPPDLHDGIFPPLPAKIPRSAASSQLATEDPLPDDPLALDAQPRVIGWHRVQAFQLVALRLIAEQVLLSSPAFATRGAVGLGVIGELSQRDMRFGSVASVYTSPRNPGAAELLQTITSLLPESVRPTAAPPFAGDGAGPEPSHFLLLLRGGTFDAELAAELARALAGGMAPVLVHEVGDGCATMAAIIHATPRELRDGGLYSPLAIEWHAEPSMQAVSLRLVAHALGAKLDKPTARHGGLSGKVRRLLAPTPQPAPLPSPRAGRDGGQARWAKLRNARLAVGVGQRRHAAGPPLIADGDTTSLSPKHAHGAIINGASTALVELGDTGGDSSAV